MNVIQGWEKSTFFQDGYAWENKENQVNLQIHEGQFGGFEINIWDIANTKFTHRLTAKNYKTAKTKAINYMTHNPTG